METLNKFAKRMNLDDYELDALKASENVKEKKELDFENRKAYLQNIAIKTLKKIHKEKKVQKKTFSFRLDESSVERIRKKANSMGMTCNKFVGEVLDIVASL